MELEQEVDRGSSRISSALRKGHSFHTLYIGTLGSSRKQVGQEKLVRHGLSGAARECSHRKCIADISVPCARKEGTHPRNYIVPKVMSGSQGTHSSCRKLIVDRGVRCLEDPPSVSKPSAHHSKLSHTDKEMADYA